MRWRYLLAETVIVLRRNVLMTLAALVTVTVALTLLAGSLLLYLEVGSMQRAHHHVDVTVQLRPDVREGQRATIAAALRSSPSVVAIRFESGREALKRFQDQWGSAHDALEEARRQLTDSFQVQLADSGQYDTLVARLGSQPGIQRVIDQRHDVDSASAHLSSIRTGAVVVSLLMTLAAAVLVGNMSRVAAHVRRSEFSVMRLVGASNWYIQAPFVLGSALIGISASLLGLAALKIGKSLFVDVYSQEFLLLFTPLPKNTVLLMVPLMAAIGATMTGAMALIASRSLLRSQRREPWAMV
ncbi:permease-like cell division protein FtsX [Actinoplanes oblitus]|uniref:Cell division protein FtsX n=1 Tax=Actinoplanes oblitus TaxID=3040509 RepID=A0ABY8W638_9ACTN|nr:permease-like cell division protein FtsX [Actinoplanes oblitus]WIM92807.1 permease-like cell division protein FtsX [Actinoplanes oblitus]